MIDWRATRPSAVVAVIVMTLVPICRPMVGMVHARVPDAVPLPPQSTLHVTRVTLSVAVPFSGTVPALVVHGPYRWIRHPLYDAVALLTVAISLIAASW